MSAREATRADAAPAAAHAAIATCGPDAPMPGPGILLRAGLVVVGSATLVAWMVIGLAHLGDRYRIGHVQGAWMALAQYANEGTLYPALTDDGRFGGTRWMPLPILVNAAAARVTGEYLLSGKAVGMVLFAALLTLLFTALRQLRCPWPLALALVCLLPATNTGLAAGTSVGGDVLPVVLQLAALMMATGAVTRHGSRWLIAAGLLAGLGAASKLTGVWAALAVSSWLAFRGDWRRLVPFVTAVVASAGVTLALVQWHSDGRFLETFLTFTFAGGAGSVGWMRSPNQIMYFGIHDALAVWFVVPFAVLGVLLAARASALTVYHHALAWSLLLTLLVFTDVGAGFNQLLDPAVLTIVVTGLLAARLAGGRGADGTLATVLALAVIWGGSSGVRERVPELRTATARLRTGETPPAYTPRPLAGVVSPEDTLLSEDPGVPVLLGQTPVVLDAFMLRRLDELRPTVVDGLIARIGRGEFDHVVLVNALDEDERWWREYHFGPRVVAALREQYVLVGQANGYYLYRPSHPRGVRP